MVNTCHKLEDPSQWSTAGLLISFLRSENCTSTLLNVQYLAAQWRHDLAAECWSRSACQAWFVLFQWPYHLGILTSHPGKLSLLLSAGWEIEYWPDREHDALWLQSKGRYGSSHLSMNVQVTGKNSLIPTCATPEHVKRWTMMNSYINTSLLYFTTPDPHKTLHWY